MNLADAMTRIQDNARQIKNLLKKRQTPKTAAAIQQHALLIERESSYIAGLYTATQGNA